MDLSMSMGLRGSPSIREGVGVSTLAQLLFGSGEEGFLFGDFAEPDELFTTFTGPTNVASDSDPCGLALDDHSWGANTLAQMIAAATELVTNGTFATTSNWTSSSGGTLSVAANVGRVTNSTATFGYNYQSFPTVVGRTYRVTARGVSATLANVNVGTTQSGGQYIGDTGISASTFTRYFVATGTTMFIALKIGGNTIGQFAEFADVSVKLVPGQHGVQATSAARPTWRSNSGNPYLQNDGTDDCLILRPPTTTYTVMVKARLTLGSALRHLAGACDAGVTNRFQLFTDNSDKLTCRVGSGAVVTSTGPSRLNTTFVGGFQFDGTTVSLIEDGAVTVQDVQSGVPTTTTPIGLWALNNNGAPSNFFPGNGYAALGIDRLLTASEIATVTNRWGTAS